jgi:hypothetical protein
MRPVESGRGDQLRMVSLVVEGSGPENRRTERSREFESTHHPPIAETT